MSPVPTPPACRLCGAAPLRTIHRRGRWRYRRCGRCGLVVLQPMPGADEALAHYEGYLPAGADAVRAWRFMMQPVISASLRLIAGRMGSRPGKVLDVGCGFGFFLAAMAGRGWQTAGIEPVPGGRHYARETFGLDIFPGPLERVPLAEKTFDLVSLFYVIEHLPDPFATVRHVHRLLKPGGMILLRWPHTTPIVQLLGPLARRLDLYHTPYHLFDFSAASMERMLTQSGFERIETVVGGHTSPPVRLKRWISRISAGAAEGLYRMSNRRWLLPGISKTTVAFKARDATAGAPAPPRPGRS